MISAGFGCKYASKSRSCHFTTTTCSLQNIKFQGTLEQKFQVKFQGHALEFYAAPDQALVRTQNYWRLSRKWTAGDSMNLILKQNIQNEKSEMEKHTQNTQSTVYIREGSIPASGSVAISL